MAAIKNAAPDIVLSTVVGDANKPFYEQLARAGLTPGKMPVLSFTIGEDELRELPVNQMIGDYAAWSYFQSIDSPVNRSFVQQFKARYGAERTTSDSIAAAYNGVNLWAQAVREVGTESTSEVRTALRRQSREVARRHHHRGLPKRCTRGAHSTSARFEQTVSSTSSGASRSRSGPFPTRSYAAAPTGMLSWRSYAPRRQQRYRDASASRTGAIDPSRGGLADDNSLGDVAAPSVKVRVRDVSSRRLGWRLAPYRTERPTGSGSVILATGHTSHHPVESLRIGGDRAG